MTITIDGTTGIASVDGSAGSPSVRGSDANSGIVYSADNVAFSTAGTSRANIDSSGDLNVEAGNLNVSKPAIPTVLVQNSTDTSYSTVKLQQSSGSGGYFAVTKLGTNSSATGGANAAQLWQSADAPIVVGVNNAEVAQFTTDGLKLSSSKGINFSAYATSGNPSSNLLDDYEEGTFTPSLANGFHSGATFTTTSGLYVKIGSYVLATFYIQLDDADTNNAIIQIGGLPFTTTNATHNSASLSPGGGNLTYHNIVANDSAHSASCYVSRNVNYISLYRDGTNNNFRGANNQAQDDKWLVGFVNYFTDA